MAKKIKSYIKLTIPAGMANPAPPVGPALGQRGLNIMEFCKRFNKETSALDSGVPVPVIIKVYSDKSFDFSTKTSPASFYLKKFAKVPKGSSATKKDSYIGSISLAECREIARIKIEDLSAHSLETATKVIIGSAESMGIEVHK